MAEELYTPPTLSGLPLSEAPEATLPTACTLRLEAVACRTKTSPSAPLTSSLPAVVGAVPRIERRLVSRPNLEVVVVLLLVSLLPAPSATPTSCTPLAAVETAAPAT